MRHGGQRPRAARVSGVVVALVLALVMADGVTRQARAQEAPLSLEAVLARQDSLLGPAPDSLRTAVEDSMPRYLAPDFFTAETRALLARHGVRRLDNLYFGASGFLLYDTRRKRAGGPTVNTHIVFAPSARRPGESFEEAEARAMRERRRWHRPPPAERSLARLRPEAQAAFDSLFAAAAAEGLVLGRDVRVVETYRAPAKQLYYLARRRSWTLTSRHAFGMAVDFAGRGLARLRELAAASGRFRFVPHDLAHIELAPSVAAPPVAADARALPDAGLVPPAAVPAPERAPAP